MVKHFKSYSPFSYEPPKCWVGEQQKVCYASQEEAEAAALIAEHDHDAPKLSVYHCEFGDHWHLSSHKSGYRLH